MIPIYEFDNSDLYVSDDGKKYICVNQNNINKYVNDIFSILEKYGWEYICGTADGVKRGYIMPNGKFINIHSRPHYWFDEIVVEFFHTDESYSDIKYSFSSDFLDKNNLFDLMGCIRINGFNEDFIALPPRNVVKNISLEQQSSLEEWLNYYFYKINKIEISVVSSSGGQVTYNRNEYEPKEIVQKINRYYNTDMLYENKNK